MKKVAFTWREYKKGFWIQSGELCNDELEQKRLFSGVYCTFVATGYDCNCLETFFPHTTPLMSDPEAPAVTQKDWLRLLCSTASKSTCPGANLIG